MAAVIMVSCGVSTPTVSKSSTTKAASVTTTSTTSTSTTTTLEPDSGSSGSSSGSSDTSTTPVSGAACRLVTAADLTTAGITGTIAKGEPQQSALMDDPTSSVCSFDISETNGGANLLVELSPNGGKSMYSTLQALDSDVTHPIANLGDEAEYTAKKSADPDDNGFTDLQVLVRKGDTVVEFGTPTGLFANEASMTALAKAIIPKLP